MDKLTDLGKDDIIQGDMGSSAGSIAARGVRGGHLEVGSAPLCFLGDVVVVDGREVRAGMVVYPRERRIARIVGGRAVRVVSWDRYNIMLEGSRKRRTFWGYKRFWDFFSLERLGSRGAG